jgi:RNA-binding protein
MAARLTNAERRNLKARAQRLDAVIRLGHEGTSDAFYRALDEALERHELVKVRFADFKAEKKTVAPQIVERTGSELVTRVGHVAVYYRARPKPGPGQEN